MTTLDRYPLPHIQSFASDLAGKTVFSKIDLCKAYHQIPVHADSVCKTAITTEFGLFEWLRTPFGLCNAAQSFQRLMDNMARGLVDVFVYLDDILVASCNPATHRAALRCLCERLDEYGLQLNVEKCSLDAPKWSSSDTWWILRA